MIAPRYNAFNHDVLPAMCLRPCEDLDTDAIRSRQVEPCARELHGDLLEFVDESDQLVIILTADDLVDQFSILEGQHGWNCIDRELHRELGIVVDVNLIGLMEGLKTVGFFPPR